MADDWTYEIAACTCTKEHQHVVRSFHLASLRCLITLFILIYTDNKINLVSCIIFPLFQITHAYEKISVELNSDMRYQNRYLSCLLHVLLSIHHTFNFKEVVRDIFISFEQDSYYSVSDLDLSYELYFIDPHFSFASI